MKISKGITNGRAFLGLELTADEKKSLESVRLAGEGFSGFTGDSGYLVRAHRAEYGHAGVTLDCLQDRFHGTSLEDLAQMADNNYHTILGMILQEDETCKTIEIVTRDRVVVDLANSGELYYRAKNGQIKKLD